MNQEEQWKHWNQDDINQEIANTLVSIFKVIESQQELIDMIADFVGINTNEEE
jgi:hypothetical protein